MTIVHLRGITWDYARGHDPLVATAAAYQQAHPGVQITWTRRSLQAFADRPIAAMVRDDDLLVIDHPHVGEVAREGSLVPLDQMGRVAELPVLAAHSVGQSHASYHYGGHQWALAIDAATPVAAFRPDRLERAPRRFAQVLDLARRRQVALALIPVNCFMTFMGLARNLDHPVAEDPERLLAPDHHAQVFEAMQALAALVPERCFDCSPIEIYEWMSRDADGPAYSPWGYGYTNYSRAGYAPLRLIFADAPGLDDNGPRGTVLGGTGLAVSAHCPHREVAVDYAFFVASAPVQTGLYTRAGGQPGHAAAWDDDACNSLTGDFFRNTRQTMETAWLRPRFAGYMQLQDRGGDIVQACLKGALTATQAAEALDAAYRHARGLA